MESSLSKLSSELGVTPFGLTPKSKVGRYQKIFLNFGLGICESMRCKVYALMENSLSELSSELGVTPFGLVDTGHIFHTSLAKCLFF